MTKLKLLCAGLAVAVLFTGCKAVNDGVSKVESEVSKVVSEISSDASRVESNVRSDVSEFTSELSTPSHNSVPESSHLPSESAPTSGALSELSSDVVDVHAPAVVYDLSTLSNKKQGWGQGVQVDEKNRPTSPLAFQEKYGKYDANFIGADSPTLYLTFDCGYENGCTPPILDTLKEKNVKAVFFCTLDYIKSQPELVQRMIDEGHAIGNHSDKHPSFPDVSIERREQEIQNVHTYMLDNFDYTMTLFRFPSGEFSEQALAQTQEMGYKSVFWSYAYADWDPKKQIGPEKALPKITKALHPGAIYLLHAVSPDNVKILGDFIDTTRENGYEFQLFS